jgi:hypothetical protein
MQKDKFWEKMLEVIVIQWHNLQYQQNRVTIVW